MFVCFELSFVTQSVFLWADSYVLKNASMGKIPYMCVNLLLPIVLDGTSIFVIMLLHRYAYNPHQLQRRSSSVISQSKSFTLVGTSVGAPSMSQTSLNGEDYDDNQLKETAKFMITVKETSDMSEDYQIKFEQKASFSSVKKIDEQKRRLTRSVLKPHSLSEFEVMFQAGQSTSETELDK